MSRVIKEYNSWKFSTCTSLVVTGFMSIFYAFFNQLLIQIIHNYSPLIICSIITFIGSYLYIRYAISYAWPEPKSIESNE
jgi:hypothetical protein